MNDLLLLIAGIGIGAKFAEQIREVAPVLKPPVDEKPETTQ